MQGSQSTVVVVEDDLDVCDSLEAIVTALGHLCHTFDSAEAFLMYWDGRDCDVLIVDVDLPEMDGVELLTKLRASGCTTVTIIHTGRNDSRLQSAALKLGGPLIVHKGSDTNRIADLLKSLIGIFRGQ